MKAAHRHSRKNNLIAALLCVTMLAGCSGQAGPKAAGTAAATADTAKPGDKIKPLQTIAPLPTPMETFRALAPPTGLALKPLFSGPAPDTEARMKRLEDAVQSLRSDFDTVVPSLVRMVAMEKDIKELVKQLQKLTGEVPAPEIQIDRGEPVSNEDMKQADAAVMGPPAPAKAEALAPGDTQEPPEAPLPPAEETPEEPSEDPQAAAALAPSAAASNSAEPAQPAAAAASKTAAGTVSAVRIGDHGVTTRIVLDMTAQPAYTTAVQNDGKRLVVELWDMDWAAAPKQTVPGKTLVSAYSYENGKAFFDLTAPSRIVTQKILPGDGGKGGKLVIDIGKTEK